MNNVYGYGELITDHIFVGDRLTYTATYGGGSVWNALAGLSADGIPTVALGFGGDD